MLFFKWWYGAGFEDQIKRFKRRVLYFSDFFSLSLLTATLFSPYKNDVDSYSGGVTAQIQQLKEGLISRFVGFWIRLAIIIAGSTVVGVLSVFNCLWLAIWAMMPLLVIALPVIGVLQ
ncbi:hypothetical protein HY844_01690 [Candidatus Berkelbacteria bacterium]|nr:hypothetical protein [Candidatus Berkelbacteria bacterium]